MGVRQKSAGIRFMSERPLVLHDFFIFPGGGEKVAMTLVEAFGAQLWTGHLDLKGFPPGYFSNTTPLSLNGYRKAPWWIKFSKTGSNVHGCCH